MRDGDGIGDEGREMRDGDAGDGDDPKIESGASVTGESIGDEERMIRSVDRVPPGGEANECCKWRDVKAAALPLLGGVFSFSTSLSTPSLLIWTCPDIFCFFLARPEGARSPE